MPVVNERVMDMVREEIQRRPEVTSQELFDRAKKMERGIRSLSARQFNALYPLQVRRTLAPRRRRGRGAAARARSTAGRERYRVVLLEFARAVAGAQDRGALVEVVGNLEQWVDRLVSGRATAEAGAPAKGRRAARKS